MGFHLEKHSKPNILALRISFVKNIKSVSYGLFHVACLDYNGNLFTYGGNSYGQMGIGVDRDSMYNIYLQQLNLSTYKAVSCS